jgi:hypothetical protein
VQQQAAATGSSGQQRPSAASSEKGTTCSAQHCREVPSAGCCSCCGVAFGCRGLQMLPAASSAEGTCTAVYMQCDACSGNPYAVKYRPSMQCNALRTCCVGLWWQHWRGGWCCWGHDHITCLQGVLEVAQQAGTHTLRERHEDTAAQRASVNTACRVCGVRTVHVEQQRLGWSAKLCAGVVLARGMQAGLCKCCPAPSYTDKKST